MRAFHHIRLTPLNILASLSILGLIGVASMQAAGMLRPDTPAGAAATTTPRTTSSEGSAAWQQEMMLLGIATSSESGGTEDPIGMIAPQVLAQLIGEYQGLQASGKYSADAGAEAAERIAPNVKANVPYTPYGTASLTTDPDASYESMLTYRSDMRTALAPLLRNTRAEYEIYAEYAATGDEGYLRELQDVANNYAEAAEAMVRVTVPRDIAQTHLDTMNALAHFSATLSAMVTHAGDPLASVALLRTYNSAELAVVNSFDRIATYERLKRP